MAKEFSKTFMGYRRENGRVGVRNHVVILPVDDISNAAAEAVGRNVFGTLAIPTVTEGFSSEQISNCFSGRSLEPGKIRMLLQWS